MRKLMIAAAASMMILLPSCNKTYTIHGTVTDPKLEGAQIFLVPVEGPATHETVDSVYIKDFQFTFKGTKEQMADLRIEMSKRIGTQNLLVVTEPGDIYVSVGAISSGFGTPQNDSLQVWKELTEKKNKDFQYQAGNPDKEEAKAVRRQLYEDYKARTQQLAHNTGDSTTLGKFLNKIYPTK